MAANASPLPSQRQAGQEFKGDLDAIVLRAMQRDPARRYPSAAELNADIGRFSGKSSGNRAQDRA